MEMEMNNMNKETLLYLYEKLEEKTIDELKNKLRKSVKDKEYNIEKIYDESTVLYSQFKELNVEHIIYAGIYSYDNKLIGLIALEYQKNHPYHEDIINLLDIKGRAAKIAQLLQFSKNNNVVDAANIDNA